MTAIGIGDLAQSLSLRRQNAQLKADFTRLGEEATTGRSTDVARMLGGDFRATAGLQRSLSLLEAFRTSTAEATLLGETMQTSIGAIGTSLADMAASALNVVAGENWSMLVVAGQDARERFAAAISALNVQAGARAVFSGAAIGKSFASPDEILSSISATIPDPASSDDLIGAVNAWFDDPAGFAAHYKGSSSALSPIPTGPGEEVRLEVTAADPAFRSALKGIALAAFATRAGTTEGAVATMRKAAEQMFTAEAEITELSGAVGTVQGRIAEAQTRNTAEKLSIQLALSSLTEVDQYESATLLEATEQQLNTLYSVTARLTKLSLTEYL